MLRYVKWTTLEVEAGILATGIIGILILGFLTGFLSGETIGFLVGIVAAGVLFYSLALSVETSVDMGDAVSARKHASKSYGLRVLALILGTMLAAKLGWFNLFTALMALFSIKVGLYLQPFTHKLFCRWFGLKDELSPDALYLPEEEEGDGDDDEKPDRIDRWLQRRYGK